MITATPAASEELLLVTHIPPFHDVAPTPPIDLNSPSFKINNPSSNSTPNPRANPQTDPPMHHRPASYHRSIHLAAVGLAGSAFAAAGLAAHTVPAAARTGPDSHTDCCRSTLRRRRAGLAGCHSTALADRSLGLGRGSRRARGWRLGGWVVEIAGMRAARLGRVFEMPLWKLWMESRGK